MKSAKVRIVLSAIAAVMAFPAAADDLPRSIFGYEIGHSTAAISATGADSIKDKDKSLRVYSGVELNKNFDMEVGYTDFGEFSVHIPTNNQLDRLQAQALYVSAVGIASSDSVKLIGRVGVDWWNTRYISTATVLGVPEYGEGNGRGRNIHFGAGLDFHMSDNYSIRVDWQRYKKIGKGVTVSYQSLPSETLSGGDITVLDAGLIIRF